MLMSIMVCPRCGGRLETLSLGGREAHVCEDCAYVGVPVDHESERDDPESWETAIRRFKRKHSPGEDVEVDPEPLPADALEAGSEESSTGNDAGTDDGAGAEDGSTGDRAGTDDGADLVIGEEIDVEPTTDAAGDSATDAEEEQPGADPPEGEQAPQ